MKTWKKKLRNGLVLVAALCAVGVLMTTNVAGEGNEIHMEVWVETAEALERTALGDCANQAGTRCHEQCISWPNGATVPTGYFECR